MRCEIHQPMNHRWGLWGNSFFARSVAEFTATKLRKSQISSILSHAQLFSVMVQNFLNASLRMNLENWSQFWSFGQIRNQLRLDVGLWIAWSLLNGETLVYLMPIVFQHWAKMFLNFVKKLSQGSSNHYNACPDRPFEKKAKELSRYSRLGAEWSRNFAELELAVLATTLI